MISEHRSLIADCFKPGETVRGFVYKNYSIPPHNHDFYEINIILKGHGIHIINGKKISVSAGDVFVIPPEVIHAYIKTVDFDVYHILVHPELMKEISEEGASVPGFSSLIEIEPTIRSNSDEAHFLHLEKIDFFYVSQELEAIREGGRLDFENSYPLIKHAAIKIIFYFACKLWLQIQNVSKKRDKTDILQSFEYINHHLSEKLTVESLSSLCHVSPATYNRQFKRLMGISPAKYIINLRINEAKKLISQGMSITSAAMEAGFFDASHLKKYL